MSSEYSTPGAGAGDNRRIDPETGAELGPKVETDNITVETPAPEAPVETPVTPEAPVEPTVVAEEPVVGSESVTGTPEEPAV